MKQSKNKILLIVKAIISLLMVLMFSGCGTWMTVFGHHSPRDSFLKNTYQLSIEDLYNFKAGLKPINGEIKAKYLLALHFQRLNRHLNAIEELNEVIKMEPYFPEAYNALGVSYDSLGKYAMSEECYKMALRLNPDLAYVVNNMGYSYVMRGEYEKAQQYLEIAVIMEEKNIKYQNNLLLASHGAENAGQKSIQDLVSPNEPEETMEIEVEPELLMTASFEADSSEGVIDDDIIEKKLEEPIDKKKNSAENTDQFILAGSVKVSEVIKKGDTNNGERFYKISPSGSIQNPDSENKDSEILIANMIYHNDKYIRVLLGKDMAISCRGGDYGYQIEISNGNGVKGAAKRMSVYLRGKGFPVNRLTDADHFNHTVTQIYFGIDQLSRAQALLENLPEGQQARLVEMDQNTNRIRLLIGKDVVFMLASSR